VSTPIVALDTELARLPIDVPPAQRAHFAGPEPGIAPEQYAHQRGRIERARRLNQSVVFVEVVKLDRPLTRLEQPDRTGHMVDDAPFDRLYPDSILATTSADRGLLR
jgi:hypothetical protein